MVHGLIFAVASALAHTVGADMQFLQTSVHGPDGFEAAELRTEDSTDLAYYLALDITTQSNEFLYNGAAWEQTAAYTDPSGNRLLAPFFSTDAVGLRVEMNGQSHDFFFENSDLGKSLHTLVTGTPVLQTPCSGVSSSKPYAYAMVQTSTAHSDLWGVVATNSAEPLYCTDVDRLSFNAYRLNLQFRIGILRDEESCCCCPGSADGIGIHSVSSGAHEWPGTQVFYASRVYVITPTPAPTPAPTPDPTTVCTWLSTTSNDNILECTDGTLCSGVSDGWGCCEDHGGRARCPPNFPAMCEQRACGGYGDHCCEVSCSHMGGVRECPQEASTPAPTPAPTTSLSSATGDPHLQNMFGQRFDLVRPGKSVLVSVPRGTPVEDALLVVEADARRLGTHCSDMYFQEINATGTWANKVRPGGLHFDAHDARDETPKWLKLGLVELKVGSGHTDKGQPYLNVYVKNLQRTGYRVGGLLGEDDHTEAAAPEEGCQKMLSLEARLYDQASHLQGSVAIGY